RRKLGGRGCEWLLATGRQYEPPASAAGELTPDGQPVASRTAVDDSRPHRAIVASTLTLWRGLHRVHMDRLLQFTAYSLHASLVVHRDRPSSAGSGGRGLRQRAPGARRPLRTLRSLRSIPRPAGGPRACAASRPVRPRVAARPR